MSWAWWNTWGLWGDSERDVTESESYKTGPANTLTQTFLPSGPSSEHHALNYKEIARVWSWGAVCYTLCSCCWSPVTPASATSPSRWEPHPCSCSVTLRDSGHSMPLITLLYYSINSFSFPRFPIHHAQHDANFAFQMSNYLFIFIKYHHRF